MSEKKRVRHSPKQIVEKLQEAERRLNAGQSAGQVLQTLGVSEETFLPHLSCGQSTIQGEHQII